MSEEPELPRLDELVADLRVLRERGLVRLRHSDVASLTQTANHAAIAANAPGGGPGSVEALLRAAVTSLGDGDLGRAAAATFGLARGARDAAAPDRRRRGALVYGVSVERFRKHHELIVLEQVAEEILKLCQASAQPSPALSRAELGRQLALDGLIGGVAVPIVVHVEPVELLCDVDIIVVPENTYLELPQHFKSSVSASVRSAAALRSPSGEIVADVIGDELKSWMQKHGRPGLPVALGTVVATSPGRLAEQGVRRIYHTAVVSPRPGTNEYDVDLTAVATGVRSALSLARSERPLFDPPLASVGFPLLGAGRGGLHPATSFAWIWNSLEREIRENGPWQIHFITRQQSLADLIVDRLADARVIPVQPDKLADGRSSGP